MRRPERSPGQRRQAGLIDRPRETNSTNRDEQRETKRKQNRDNERGRKRKRSNNLERKKHEGERKRARDIGREREKNRPIIQDACQEQEDTKSSWPPLNVALQKSISLDAQTSAATARDIRGTVRCQLRSPLYRRHHFQYPMSLCRSTGVSAGPWCPQG